MVTIWNIIFYKPLYNALFFVIDILPNNSLFLAVIILTIIVRLLISPLSYKAIKTQLKTKQLQPMLKDIKKIEDKQDQARATLALYKKHGVNPFSSFLLILVQLPIILALYWVFKDGGLEIDPSLLYSFVQEPDLIVKTSFGLDLSQKSILLAFLTGFTQYIYLATASTMKQDAHTEDHTEQEKMMMMVQQSMKYIMPVMITVFAYVIGGAVALYWITSNIFMIIQEQYLQKKIAKENLATA